MKHLSLAARYRPQTFAQVAGQDTVKAVLSRAAAEGRPAPAYLLSGTRGVGKTTIARIFAKALNLRARPRSGALQPVRAVPQNHPGRACGCGRNRRARPTTAWKMYAPCARTSATPPWKAATRSLLWTKPTCSRATPSTLCSKLWKSRRKTWSSSLPPPRPTNFPSPL